MFASYVNEQILISLNLIIFCGRKAKKNVHENSDKRIVATKNPVFDYRLESEYIDAEYTEPQFAQNEMKSYRSEPQQWPPVANEKLTRHSACCSYPTSDGTVNDKQTLHSPYCSYSAPDRVTNEPGDQPLYDSIPCQTQQEETSIYQSPVPILADFDTGGKPRHIRRPSLSDPRLLPPISSSTTTLSGRPPEYGNVYVENPDPTGSLASSPSHTERSKQGREDPGYYCQFSENCQAGDEIYENFT